MKVNKLTPEQKQRSDAIAQYTSWCLKNKKYSLLKNSKAREKYISNYILQHNKSKKCS